MQEDLTGPTEPNQPADIGGPEASGDSAGPATSGGSAEASGGSADVAASSRSAGPAMVMCPFCESAITITAQKCRHCGEWVARDCENCGTPLRNEWAARGTCAQCSATGTNLTKVPGQAVVGSKSRAAAAIFALLLGWMGAHKFYLDKPGMGIVYLVFFWTTIPAVVSFFEGIGYLLTSDEDFWRRFG